MRSILPIIVLAAHANALGGPPVYHGHTITVTVTEVISSLELVFTGGCSTAVHTVVSGLNDPDQSTTLSAYGITASSTAASTVSTAPISIPTVVTGLNNQTTTLSAYGVTAYTPTISILPYSPEPPQSTEPASYSIFGGVPFSPASSQPTTTSAGTSYLIFGGNPFRTQVGTSDQSTLTTKVVTTTSHPLTKTMTATDLDGYIWR